MSATEVKSVADVIAQLRAIESANSTSDGVACFARIYRQVTEEVNADLAGQHFDDGRFLERLDVLFANLFFTALEAYERDPSTTPLAWTPLFEERSREGITHLQFALAGINAHINRDLPVALVAICDELNLDLHEETPEHVDFERVNLLLAQVEQQMKGMYLSGSLAHVDRLLHRLDRVDDAAAMFGVSKARDAAWASGRVLWALRGDPKFAAEFLHVLDRMVGLAGQGLLVPAEALIDHREHPVAGASPSFGVPSVVVVDALTPRTASQPAEHQRGSTGRTQTDD